MFAILNVVVPVFMIIGLGYFAVRFRLYPSEGVRGLVSFVNNFATPCLLFQAMLTSDFGSTFNFYIIIPYYVGSIIVFITGALIASRFFKYRPGESVSAGFAAMFTNTVLVGIPVLQRAYGDAAMPVVFSIIAFHAPMLITLAMLVMELVRRDGAPLHQALGVAAIRIVQNPLLWGVLLGVICNVLDVDLPEAGDGFLSLMAAAVLPVALFGLGGALNEYKLADNWAQALAMSLLKLVLHPLIVWIILVPVLHIDHDLARYAVLLSAMPAGINVYVFASYYNRAVNVATNSVLISTVLSVVTITGWLYFLSIY